MSLLFQPVTVDDLHDINDLWYTAFDGLNGMMPDTPAIRKWWYDANLHDLLHKPSAHYWKVVDPANNNALVAYAKWDLSPAHERGARFPPWHEEMDVDQCRSFFGALESERQRLVGDRKNYYLDMLATNPQYRRRGAGGMLVRWGCDQADQNGVPSYVDASAGGRKLYEKFGFQNFGDEGCAAREAWSMVREPNPESQS